MIFDEKFPDVRETGETKLRQSQLVMLRLLKIFDYLCRKHEIQYFLTGGSLLGAIRHNGFIPWDDDLDISLTAENYLKFVEKAANELPSDIFFQNYDTDPYYRKTDPIDARLRDKYSSYRRKNGNNKWHEGLQVDISIFHKAYLPHSIFIVLENKILNKIWKDPGKRFSFLQKIEKLKINGTVYGNNWMQLLGTIKCPNYMKSEEIKPLKRVAFEDMEAYIPSGYDAYLTRQYGNYMKLPPKDERGGHRGIIAEPFRSCEHPEALNWEER
jgi:lipopolysaccharide cholinephosphotransferase